MLTIKERSKNANKRIAEYEHQQREAQKQAQEEQRKKAQRRSYIIGDLVSKYFPEVRSIEPGTNAENRIRFQEIESILAVLANDQELVRHLKDKARLRLV